jgi:preprotein translocase subunit YajC
MNETTATEVQPVEGAAVTGQQPQPGGMGMLVPMLLILAIFYFMMIRPQQRKEKERRKMIENLRAGAKIVFAGGLMGTISEATEKTFKVEIAPGTVIEIARSSVSGVVDEAQPDAK